VPAYIIETGRSYENPIDSDDYQNIDIQDSGPGSYLFGKDEVWYIGDPEQTCVAYCNSQRKQVHRFYSGKMKDHTYQNSRTVPEEWAQFRSYNHEPRQKARRYFQLVQKNPGGAVPLYIAYDSANKDSYLSTSGGADRLGYIFTSASAAQSSGVLKSGENAVPLYEYVADFTAEGKGKDHFYTVDPSKEVNLEIVPGIAPPIDAMNQEYKYQGIIGYVMLGRGPRPKKRIIDIGSIKCTGEVDRTGWYGYGQWGWYGSSNNFSLQDYWRWHGETPGTTGWNIDNISILSTDAYFEHFWGKNGAVKAAVPRSLNFHDAFEGQIVYYLYDTSYPWNGPVYGINLITTTAPCCSPTYTASDTCVPVFKYHTYDYQIKQSAWRTQKTHITVEVPDQTSGAQESFWSAGTDDHILFFRYITNTGFFAVGEQINGWLITACRYFGDDMDCGYMQLTAVQQNGTGGAFVYEQSYTSTNGAEIVALAGYGIKDKAAFFGVYEFPKKVSYYRVNIDKNALIPERSLDVAKIEGRIGKNGKLKRVNIINAGFGYRNPQLTIELPDILRDQGFIDTAKNVNENFENDLTPKIQLNLQDQRDFKVNDANFKEAASYVKNQKYVTESDFTGELKQAKLKAVVDAQGCIQDVIIVDPGAGYPANWNPQIVVVDRERDKRSDTFVGEGMKGWQDVMDSNLSRFGTNTQDANAILNTNKDTMKGITKEFDHDINTDIIRGYITMTDIKGDDKTKMCSEVIPNTCFQPNSGLGFADWAQYWDREKLFTNLTLSNPNWNENNGTIDYFWNASAPNARTFDRYMSNGMPGIYGGGCIEVAQANLYTVRRFFDIPCPYVSYDADGKETIYGYLPFKYCASKKEKIQLRVSLSIEGDVSGAGAGPNAAFMNWLKSLPAPKLTRPRKVNGPQNKKLKTHKCTRGDEKGKCYKTGPGQYAFVPVGGDENTFDYGLNNMTELEQLETWIANNYVTYAGTFFTQQQVDQNGNPTGVIYGPANELPYNTVKLKQCTNGKFPAPCWHNFVTDGILEVSAGYDCNGNKIPSDDICTGSPFIGCDGLDEVVHAAIAIDPNLINDSNYIELGAYEGTFTYRNWSTASAMLLEDTLNNYGNPYFDECDLTY
jgi:hypothetical protein